MEIAHFTPLSAAAGGLLIGAGTVVYRWASGRYAGISGIARGFAFGGPDRPLDALFIAGLLVGGALWFWIFARSAPVAAVTPLAFAAFGGILVGLGTRLGQGCTSGHGVCGLARFSPRSLAAVCTFVFTGIVTVAVLHFTGHVQ